MHASLVLTLIFSFLLISQLAAALWRQHVPTERHERSLQQHRHPAAGAASPPPARPLRAALPPAQLPVWQPGLLQLLHHEKLLLRRGQRSGRSSDDANTKLLLLLIWNIGLSYSCEHDISGTLRGNFFKFGTNTHLDSRMNWSEFGGQGSKVMATVTSQSLGIDLLIMRKFAQMSNRLKGWSGDILYPKG